MKVLNLLALASLILPLYAHAHSQECEWKLEDCRARCSAQFPDSDAANEPKFQACVRNKCTEAKACGGNAPAFAFEDAAAYVPRHLVPNNGKAFTECQDPAEQEQRLRGKRICVNADGDYYFLAN